MLRPTPVLLWPIEGNGASTRVATKPSSPGGTGVAQSPVPRDVPRVPGEVPGGDADPHVGLWVGSGVLRGEATHGRGHGHTHQAVEHLYGMIGG